MHDKLIYLPQPRYEGGRWTDYNDYASDPYFMEQYDIVRWPQETLDSLPIPKYHEYQEITYFQYYYNKNVDKRKHGPIRGIRFGGILREEKSLEFLTPEKVQEAFNLGMYYIFYFVAPGGHEDTVKEKYVIG